jgi:DNA-binding HxlR family transcriptional regulator
MQNEPPHLEGDCRKIGKILSNIGDKWTILLFRSLGDERMRFKDLHRALDGISQRMLTVTLRNLERDGLVIRTVYPTIPPKVEYELSERGRSLQHALRPIGEWALENQSAIEETRREFEERYAAKPEPAPRLSLTAK